MQYSLELDQVLRIGRSVAEDYKHTRISRVVGHGVVLICRIVAPRRWVSHPLTSLCEVAHQHTRVVHVLHAGYVRRR